jgi:hypothetical protein
VEPRIGEPLPRADEAYIDPRKLVEYALDPRSGLGRDKAVVFERALGITMRDAHYLRDAVLEGLPDHPVSAVRPAVTSKNVTTWEVLVPVRGINGRTLPVVTGWRVDGERPELVTIRVRRKPRRGQ